LLTVEVPDTIENSRIVLTGDYLAGRIGAIHDPEIVRQGRAVENRRLAGKDAVRDAAQKQVASLRTHVPDGQN
jgi:hypothetical protein